MPTAPRSPTQPMKPISTRRKRKGARQSATARGRASSIRLAARPRAGSRCSSRAEGTASMPSSRNITPCASQVAACCTAVTLAMARTGRCPTTRPATYTARKPLPPAMLVAENTAIAPASASSGCRPSSSSRFRPVAISRPPTQPSSPPRPSCTNREESMVPRPTASFPRAIQEQNSRVRKTAIGSLLPDSISSTPLTRFGRVIPALRSRKNTAAASVEASTAPSSRASRAGSPNSRCAAPAVMPVVSATPRVASSSEGAMAARIGASRVCRPPSKRMIARASAPMA